MHSQEYQRFLKEQGIVAISPNNTIHFALATIATVLSLIRVVQKKDKGQRTDVSQMIVPGLLFLALFMWISNGSGDASGMVYISQWWLTLQHVVLGSAVIVAGVQLAE